MRVAIFADFLSSLGGVEYYNTLLASELCERGIDVRIFSGEKPIFNYWTDELKKRDIPFMSPDVFHEDTHDRSIEKMFVHEVLYDLEAWKPDVIHCHPAGKLIVSWLELERRLYTPVIATEWTTPLPSTAHWFQADLPKLINHIDAYIATCSSVESGIRNFHHYNGDIYVVPHLIDPPRQKNTVIDTFNQSVGCISRFSAEKGVDFLLGAWMQVVTKFPDATLHLYGHGPEEDHLKEMARCLNISHSVSFEGVYAPMTGINDVASKHAIFVQPSLFESIPTSIIELMARGRVIVASSVGGIPDLFAGGAGVLTPIAGTESIANSINSLLDKPSLIEEFSKRASERFEERYALTRVVDDVVKVYQSAITKKKSGNILSYG